MAAKIQAPKGIELDPKTHLRVLVKFSFPIDQADIIPEGIPDFDDEDYDEGRGSFAMALREARTAAGKGKREIVRGFPVGRIDGDVLGVDVRKLARHLEAAGYVLCAAAKQRRVNQHYHGKDPNKTWYWMVRFEFWAKEVAQADSIAQAVRARLGAKLQVLLERHWWREKGKCRNELNVDAWEGRDLLEYVVDLNHPEHRFNPDGSTVLAPDGKPLQQQAVMTVKSGMLCTVAVGA